MGGYGAFKAALLHPERYIAAASFSGVLSVQVLQFAVDEARRTEFTVLFGDMDKLAGSQHDPAVWLEHEAQNPAALPQLFISVGQQEDLYPLSGRFHAACQALGIDSEKKGSCHRQSTPPPNFCPA